MESEVLTPTAGQTVVRTGDGHRRDHGHEHREWDRMRWELSRDFEAGVAATVHAGEEEQENSKSVELAVAASATSTLVGFKDLTALSYQIEGRAGLEAAKNANLLGIQATNNFNLIQIEQVKNAAASVLLATQNTAAILAAQAECCCEIKQLVTAEANTTRGLIDTNEKARLVAQINTLQIQNASLFAAKVAPPTPVA